MTISAAYADPAADAGRHSSADTDDWSVAERRRKRRRSLLLNGLRIAILIAFLLAWENFSGRPGEPGVYVDEFYVSRPSAIWDALRGWVDQGVLTESVIATLQNTLVGFALGAGLGFLAGFLLATNDFLADLFRPFILALNSIPRIALVPLFITWFGLGMSSKVALVTSVVFFLVFYATFSGVRDVDQQLIDTMRLMRARRWQIDLKVRLPSAMSWIISGLSVSLPFALVVAVAGEMLASNRGMGYLIQRSSGQFFVPGIFAGVLVLMVLGMLLGGLIALLERRLLRWQPGRLSDN